MSFPLDPQLSERFVKVRSDLRQRPGGGPYRHASGFITREGAVLTSAHGVEGASAITITDVHQNQHTVEVSADSVWSGDPAGPARGRAPDFAIVTDPAIGTGLRRFPIARLNRAGLSLTRLREVHVCGFPAFAETSRRHIFQDTGSIALLSNLDAGFVDLGLPTTPGELDPRSDLRSQWSGISGAPVIVGGYLVALVTEHAPGLGPARLSATPLSLLDADPDWPDWGSGVPDPAAWWGRLGVDDPSRLQVLPGEAAQAAWIADLRALAEELEGPDVGLPNALRKPTSFAVQAHEALLESFQDLTEADYEEAARRLRQIMARPTSARGSAIYGLSVAEALTSQSLITALDQLLAVHGVAIARVPGASARLVYRLAAPHVAVDDLSGECERWAMQVPDENAAREVLARLEVSTRSDAYGELLACLSNSEWNRADLLRAVRQLVEFVLSEDVAAPGAADAIERCLSGQAAAVATVFTRADAEPDSVVRDEQGFLVNEQPTLSHLRHGDFAPAGELDELDQAYWSWYERDVLAAAHRRSGRVPVFWLTGPSGAGKSVLLLQLLARLNARAGVTVLWPGSAGEQLASTTEQALSLGRGRHVIIGVDDPLTLTYQDGRSAWRAALDELGRRRQTDQPASLPIFVCCGPTEHYERFRRDHSGVVQIERYVLDPYRREFIGQLRRWYEDRTGHPASAPEEHGTQLPAQLFFEWWKGEGIEAFANRFRNRIDSRRLPELAEFFDRLLAVNRLYVGYPREAVDALTPEVRDALIPLQLDMHLANRPGIIRSGYWLSHAHLANLIYNAWFPEHSHFDQRGAHLTAAVLDAVRVSAHGWASLPLLEQLLVALDSPPAENADTRTRPEQVRTTLREAARVVAPASDALASQVLASWVDVEQRMPGGLGGWSPLADAMTRLQAATDVELGLGTLVTTLAELPAGTADEAVWSFLRGHQGWRGWILTASLLVERGLGPEHVEALAVVITARLAEGDLDAMDLLGLAMRRLPADATLRSIARALAEGSLDTAVSVAPLMAVLVSLRGDLETIALDWLGAAVRRENGVVFAEILTREQILGLAWDALFRWLCCYPVEDAADSGFARVASWHKLQDRRFQDALATHLRARDATVSAELLQILVRLLSGDNAAWSFAFHLLTPAQMRLPEIGRVTRSWLERNGDSSAWHRVYVTFCSAAIPPDPELLAIGRAHLPLTWSYAHCVPVMNAMLRVSGPDDLPAVGATAFRWMKEHPDELAGWGYLALPLVKATPASEAETVATELLRWWKEHQDTPSTSYVMRAVLAAPASEALRADAVEHAKAWLAEPRQGWGHVFLDLAPLIPADTAAAIALSWMPGALHDDRWVAVFAAVIEVLDSDRVADLARLWFSQQTGADQATGFVWRIVLETGPCGHLVHDRSFRDVINAWLAGHGRRSSWWHLWRETHKAEPSDMETVRAALETGLVLPRSYGVANMLKRTTESRPDLTDPIWDVLRTCSRTVTWEVTCLELSRAAPTAAFWELGHEYLQRGGTPSDHFSAWWRRLWNAFPEDQQHAVLRPMGRAWLADNDGQPGSLKLRQKLEEDDAHRVSPATVFGGRNRKSPTAAASMALGISALRGHSPSAAAASPSAGSAGGPATVASATPGRPAGPAVAAAAPVKTSLACASCGEPIEVQEGQSDRVRYIACLDCHASLAVDFGSGTVRVRGFLQRRLAAPVGATKPNVRQARAIVYCEQCGRTLVALIRTADSHIAIDDQCGYLHEVPAEMLERWMASELNRGGRRQDNENPASLPVPQGG